MVCVSLKPSTSTKRVRYPMEVKIPWCLMPGLLTITHSPCIASSILKENPKHLCISEAFKHLRDCLRVSFITYYMGDLDIRLSKFPAPPQSLELINISDSACVGANFTIPDWRHSLHAHQHTQPHCGQTNPTPNPSEKLRAALHLHQPHALDPHMPELQNMPHTEASLTLLASKPPRAAEKFRSLPFGSDGRSF